jgi:hypothetical protein
MLYIFGYGVLGSIFLLSGNVFCKQVVTFPLVDVTTQRDLDLQSEQKTLASALGVTKTVGGKKTLQECIAHPTDDTKILIQRQNIVCFLVQQDHLLEDLAEELAQIADYEPALAEHNDDPISKKALEQMYFSLPKLCRFNTNPYALDVAYVTHIAGLCAPLAEHIIMHLGIDLLAKAAGNKECVHDHHHDHHHDHEDGNTAVYYGLQALHWGLHVPGLYDMGQGIKHRALMIKLIQAQTIQIARYVQSAEKTYKLLRQHKADASSFESFATLRYFFAKHSKCSPDFKHLLQLLHTPTFSGEASLCSHVGNVLAAYSAYKKVSDEFKLLLGAVNRIDMYVTVAGLVKHQTTQKPWSFVTFNTTSQKPVCIINNLSHLFLPHSQPLNFSSQDGIHTLVTGDNGSGKSTYLHGIGHAVILAQTFGVVPATYCELTPFSHIYTFRFIQDNMSAGISRFYAECQRVDTIIDTVTKNSQFSFVLIDEPFTFTTPEKGHTHLQKALIDLGALPNTISFVATHYKNFDIKIKNVWVQNHQYGLLKPI